MRAIDGSESLYGVDGLLARVESRRAAHVDGASAPAVGVPSGGHRPGDAEDGVGDG